MRGYYSLNTPFHTLSPTYSIHEIIVFKGLLSFLEDKNIQFKRQLQTHTHTHTQAHILTHMYTHIHIQTHTYVHTYTHICHITLKYIHWNKFPCIFCCCCILIALFTKVIMKQFGVFFFSILFLVPLNQQIILHTLSKLHQTILILAWWDHL